MQNTFSPCRSVTGQLLQMAPYASSDAPGSSPGLPTGQTHRHRLVLGGIGAIHRGRAILLHGDIEKRRLFLPGGQGEFCRDRIIGNRQGFKLRPCRGLGGLLPFRLWKRRQILRNVFQATASRHEKAADQDQNAVFLLHENASPFLTICLSNEMAASFSSSPAKKPAAVPLAFRRSRFSGENVPTPPGRRPGAPRRQGSPHPPPGWP